MARTCPRCGREVSDADRFCSACGNPLPYASQPPEDATGMIGSGVVLPQPPVAPDGAEAAHTAADSGPLPAVDTGSWAGLARGTALLLVRRGPNEGTRFTLDGDRIGVGRGPDSEIFLDDITVSRRHAEFVREGERWYLRDDNSLNGTYVNRDRIESQALVGGDEVQIGKYRFTFLTAGESPAVDAEPDSGIA